MFSLFDQLLSHSTYKSLPWGCTQPYGSSHTNIYTGDVPSQLTYCWAIAHTNLYPGDVPSYMAHLIQNLYWGCTQSVPLLMLFISLYVIIHFPFVLSYCQHCHACTSYMHTIVIIIVGVIYCYTISLWLLSSLLKLLEFISYHMILFVNLVLHYIFSHTLAINLILAYLCTILINI